MAEDSLKNEKLETTVGQYSELLLGCMHSGMTAERKEIKKRLLPLALNIESSYQGTLKQRKELPKYISELVSQLKGLSS